MPKSGDRKPPLSLVPTRADEGILGKDGKCNALKRDGKSRCTIPAGQGTDHKGYGACQYHGGNSPSLKKHAVKVQIREIADELEMEPHEALLKVVRMDAGVVQWLRRRIQELEEPSDDMDPKEKLRVAAELGIYTEQYGVERDRLAKHAKLAVDAGIDERRIQLEEDQGELIAKAIQGILNDLKLTPDQKREAPAIARKHLTLLAG